MGENRGPRVCRAPRCAEQFGRHASEGFIVIGFLLARQRSGTGALGSLLGRHPQLRYLGEVLHPNPDRAPVAEVMDPGVRPEDVNFFRYVRADGARLRGFCDPNRRPDVVERYFDWLQERFGPRIPIIDVKYASIHHWNGGWQGAVEKPWLIRFVRKNKFPIIHLKRKNFLETYVSGRLAEENQVWHTKSPGMLKIAQIEVDVRYLLSLLEGTSDEVRLMDSWLSGFGKMIEVEYADLFKADGVADRVVMRKLGRRMGLDGDFSDLTPAFVKSSSGPVAGSIRNLDAVEHALRESRFAWMLTPE
jgi:hypothetical protein